MLHGIFALLFRSLRTDSRSFRIHLLWFGLMAVIYVSLWIAQEMSIFFGAPGLRFFRNIVYLNSAFITLLGVGFFSSVISEEKEEDTLGLMTMAGISPLGILLGKSTSRLFQVMLLLAVQYPFTLLAITLGGLTPGQIYSAYVSLLSYTILLANVGLLCSVVCRRSRDAAGLTTLWLIAYCTGPAFAFAGRMYLLQGRGWSTADAAQNVILTGLKWITDSSVFVVLYEATETGHEFEWSVQIVGNAAGGLVCFLLSWWLFGFVAKDPVSETSSRGMVARQTNRRLSLFSAGRVWDRSLIWKDFHFIAGGRAGILIRCLLYGGLYGLCYATNRPWGTNASQFPGWSMRWEDVTFGFLLFSHPLLALDAALCSGRVFQEEIKGQTLSSLLMLPRSVPDLAYSKAVGCGLALLPGIVANVLGVFVMQGGKELLGEALNEPSFWWWLMNLLLLIHLTATLSLHLRWAALGLSFGIVVGSMIATGFFVEMMMIGTGRRPDALLGLFSVLIGMACVGCHAAILLRLPALGEK